MTRPRCSAFLAMSVDGFIARPDGRLDWLDAVQAPGEDYGYAVFFAAVDTVVVGRSTWRVVLGFETWPYSGKKVVVLTHRPEVAIHGELLLAGAPEEVVARLERDGARHLYVDGGAVVSQFLAAGLLDDLTISVVPAVLGQGVRLFQGALPERALRLESSRDFPSGLVQLRYAAGDLRRPPG